MKLPLETLVPLLLGVSFALTACGGQVNSSSDIRDIRDIRDGAVEAPSPANCSQPLPLDAKRVFVDTYPGIRLGSDEAHLCSWPEPAPVANEDLSKRRFEWRAPPETYWIDLPQVGDAAGCADASKCPIVGCQNQFYETSGADPRYVLCPFACQAASESSHLLRLWRACM